MQSKNEDAHSTQAHSGQTHIKTYVRRSGRGLTAAKKAQLRDLSVRYALPYSAKTLSPAELHAEFECEQPLVLEIGFGMGQASAEIAAQNPHYNFLAIDVHTAGVLALLRRIEGGGLGNLRVIQYDAVDCLENMFPAECLAGVHIFFPDPWHKKRHHKRRLIQAHFLELLTRSMQAGAFLRIVTDWEDYAHAIKDACAQTRTLNRQDQHPEPSPAPSAKSQHHPQAHSFSSAQRAQTAFERKGIEKGHKIFEFFYVKQEPAEPLEPRMRSAVPQSRQQPPAPPPINPSSKISQTESLPL